MANIKVAVRVRPISARELNLTGSEVVVCAEPNEISLTNLKISSSKAGDSRERIRRYGFDYCFDSSDPKAKNYATQATIYETLGQSILDALFAGYNSCLVAYGQSASGKTYTMMGTKEDPGLIPRLCKGIFSKVGQENGHERIYRVTVSYLEIYNEKVRDLLKPSTSASGLRVREHPRLGPYVQGLTHHVVRTLGSLMSYVEEGTKARKTASTLQNPSSSRSHALLTVDFSQDTADAERSSNGGISSSSRRQDITSRDGSRLHLVDLAGSESAATCGGVHRLKEGANINKSLVALGNVISALAERGPTGSGPSRRYIPYRDSSLTWLLKDALGGNATTIMLATISPASGSYNETAHTLRFAQRAQNVVNRPVVNEDPVERLIRELKAEVARLKSLLLAKDIDQQTKAPCCCSKVQSSKDSVTDPQYCGESESLNTSQSDCENESVQFKNDKSLDVLPIRRFNSNDSVTTYKTSSSGSIRKFNSYEHLQSSGRFVDNYNQAKVTELNEEEDEVVNEINEPVFVDIPTLVAVLIKPDNNLQESSTQIEEICSDEVQEDSIDVDFIETGNDELDGPEKIDDVDPGERSNSTNSRNVLGDLEIGELREIPPDCLPSSPASVESSRSRGKFSKQNSVDLPSSNLNVSKKFGSIEALSKKKESTFALQRSHTNLEKRPALPDRGKKLNNIREIDDRKASIKSGNVWKTIGSNVGSKDQLQRKNSNESDKSLKDSNSGKTGSCNSIGRKPSLENLKRKTSKDSSSSSSKEEQILISSLTRDKLLRRKNSLDQEAAVATASGVRHHTAIQRVKRADIVAAVTERLYSSRKPTEESSMATSNASDTRSPPEGTDVKISSSFMARSRLQEISRKMLMKRRRNNVDTQTEAASTLRFKDTACLTDEPKIVLQDAAVLTDNHVDCNVTKTWTDHRLPVLRVKDMATLTDRRPRTNIFRCKDAESLVNDLDFDDYELHSPRNDSGVLSDDTQNYTESNLSSAEVSAEMSELYPKDIRKVPCTDSSTNTFFASPGRNSAVQTTRPETTSQRKENPENRSCSQCCSLFHECNQQRAAVSNPEKNIISISLPDTISITIESTNGLESRIAVMDDSDVDKERVKPIFNDKECQTDQLIEKKVEGSFLNDHTVRSTAIQADGRVFRIENIFQDPRSKNCDVVSDLRKETKSVTFRSSLGTSSVIDIKESDKETEWNEIHVKDIYQRKRLKGRLTQAFIAKRRSYSLSPKRPTHKLVHHNVWKNWTLPCPRKFSEFINHSRNMISVPSFMKKDVTKNLLSSSMSKECTPNNAILEEITHELSNQNSRSFKNSKKSKSVSINNLLNYDSNFSDDSLDYNEDNVATKSADVKAINLNDRKYYENFCPPDVVAHTKKKASKSTDHMDSANITSIHGESSTNVESLTNDDFDDTETQLPKRKPAEILDKSPLQDYKELILGTSLYVIDSDSEEVNMKMINHSDNVNRKKVSFSNPSSSEEIADTMNNYETSVKQSSEVALKSIIKKMKKKSLPVSENLDILQLNTEIGQFLQQKKAESTESEKVLSVLKKKDDSKDSEKPSDKKVEFANENYFKERFYGSKSVTNNEDIRSRTTSKKNIFEEYLNEATIFMRNMNSMNKHMNVTNAQSYGKRHKKRNNRRGNPSKNKDYIEIRGRKISLKNDIDKYLQPYEDEIITVESYEKCLRGIERLEACIDKTNKHNQILRNKYGVGVESAGAKSNLASPSIDSRMSSVNDSVIRQRGDVISGIESCDKSSLSTVSLPSLSSIRTDVTKQPMLSETEKFETVTTVDKYDSDYKNNNITPENDLEREIFDQLMHAVDSSKCLSLKQSRYLPKTFDFGLRGPTIYSKFRQTLRPDARRILNSDQVYAVEDYLGDIYGIENSPRAFRKTKFSDPTDIDSGTSIDSKIEHKEFCNALSEENGNLLKIDVTDETTIFKTKMEYPECLIDSMKSIDTEQTFYAEEIARRSIPKSKDSLKMESMNFRFSGPLSIVLKYPGSPRAKFLELLRERRRIVEKSRSTNAF